MIYSINWPLICKGKYFIFISGLYLHVWYPKLKFQISFQFKSCYKDIVFFFILSSLHISKQVSFFVFFLSLSFFTLLPFIYCSFFLIVLFSFSYMKEWKIKKKMYFIFRKEKFFFFHLSLIWRYCPKNLPYNLLFYHDLHPYSLFTLSSLLFSTKKIWEK